MQKIIRALCILCTLAGAALIVSAAANYAKIKARPRAAQTLVLTLDTPESTSQTSEITAKYPQDVLFVSAGREEYESGEMTLTVPRLGLDAVPVMNGTDDDSLNAGVGLFETAQLPNDKAANENTSIAGHRGAAGCEFYDIDTLQEGDEIILDYAGVRYVYTYEETVIVPQNDWTPVYCRSYESVTLISCHPKTASTHRICAIGRRAAEQ